MNDKSTGNKSVNAFRTISEVAARLGVPKHVLRFWEGKFPQVKPMKRGGGRRYYRPEDIDLLQGIRTLLHSDGYTIKGVQKILRQRGVQFVKDRGEQAGGSSVQMSGDEAAVPPPGKSVGDTPRRAKSKGGKTNRSDAGSQARATAPDQDNDFAKAKGSKPAPIEAGARSRKLNEVERHALRAIIDQLGECRVMLSSNIAQDKSTVKSKSAGAGARAKRA